MIFNFIIIVTGGLAVAYLLWPLVQPVPDRHHRNCQWPRRWRHRPCYACISDLESEVFQ